MRLFLLTIASNVRKMSVKLLILCCRGGKVISKIYGTVENFLRKRALILVTRYLHIFFSCTEGDGTIRLNKMISPGWNLRYRLTTFCVIATTIQSNSTDMKSM